MPKPFTSTLPNVPFTSTASMPSTFSMFTIPSTSTFSLPPLTYVPAIGFDTRAWTTVNDLHGIAPGPRAQQGGTANQGQASDTVMLPQPLLTPVFSFNPIRPGAQVVLRPSPPPRDHHMTPQFHRPGYLFCFPDAPLPTLDEWVDYMTRHETYDPILARLQEAMDD
ncbi:hypothetical protein BGZ92_003511, partial [Podila epicladia]